MKKLFNFRKLLVLNTSILPFLTISCDSPKKAGDSAFYLATAKKEIATQNIVFMNALKNGDSAGITNCNAFNS
ncbi:hypothetical protein EKL97_10260 [Flavobacterium sp. LS1P28]|uniref:hypothetical protein n=1 Tax=unclassified Flavobacterium TaxID=196869 RepID=UPI000F83C46D|nr:MULTISPECIES: hypothetical protein [unclassified Flavobacterium]RTY80643.1 hypothetical protein EKL97_10260 [Flavobacterium sp. LS1P28]RTY90096.1 hypothetical protein EKM01_11485 [Flavobacterium sp. RSP46]